jgi:Domain of unknown function (DUF222)
MPEPALFVEITELLTARDKLDGILNSRLQVADVRDVMVNECGRQVRSWLIEEAHLSPEEASRRMTVAKALPFHPDLAAALIAGDISQDHTRIILGCLRHLAPDWRDVAETGLIDAARSVDPTALSQLCRELRIRSGADEDAGAGATILAALVPLSQPAADTDTRLLEQLSTASVNGQPITASIARRIACDANIIPAVLGGPSEILDFGRSRRLFSRAQRRAAAIRDKGCAWPQCQAPLSRCELHHGTYWETGGHTNHTDSIWVCTFHHWLVHHTPWTITRNNNGTIEISRT